MPSFETFVGRVFADRRFLGTLLIGGLLSFVPILNILALGYLYDYTRQVHTRGEWSLPGWDKWDTLFLDGLRFLVLWLAFLWLPVGLAALLGMLLSAVLPVVSAPATYVLLSVTCFIAPLWFSVMLHRFQKRERWLDLKARGYGFNELRASLPKLAYPLLAVIALAFLGAPLYGIALFVSHLLFLPYALLYLEGRSRGFV